MSAKHLMGLLMVWAGFTIIGLLASGMWFGAEDVSAMEILTGYSSISAAGGFLAIVTLPIGFLTNGLPLLILFDYPFLTGAFGGLVRFLLIGVFGVSTIYAVSGDFRNSLSGIFNR